MKFSTLSSLLLATAFSAQAQLTGHVDMYSSYVLRGSATTAEASIPAVQWGLDYALPVGVYVGYWGSSLAYQATVDPGEIGNQQSIENDFYAGYAGKAGEVGYDLGVTSYVYFPDYISKTLGIEPKAKVSFMDAFVMAQFNAKDVTYSNMGDTYVTAGYSKVLPFDSTVTAGAVVGWYFYADSGKYASSKVKNSQAFRNVTISVSKKVTPNLVVGFDGIIGGKSAMDADLGNALVAHASVVF